MKTDIFLIRHAKTKWNEIGKIQGSLNSSLSDEGVAQAIQLGEKFKEIKPEVICTSSLERTKETARIAMNSWGETREVQEYEGLNEIHLSEWQGKRFEEIKKIHPLKFERFMEEPHAFFMSGELPGAENYLDVQIRAMESIAKILDRNSGKKIAVISHGIVLRILLSYLRGIPLELSNTKVNIAGNTQVFHTTWIKEDMEMISRISI